MSLLVKELAAEPDNLHSISGTHRAASRGEVSGHMAHSASQALSQLGHWQSLPGWPGGDPQDFPAYLHVPFCFPAQEKKSHGKLWVPQAQAPAPAPVNPPFLGGPFPVFESVPDHQAPPPHPGAEGPNGRSTIGRCSASAHQACLRG